MFTIGPFARLLIGVAILLGVAPGRAAERAVSPVKSSWTYRAQLPEVRPVSRTISMSPSRPEELLDEPPSHGVRQYAQIRYGSENSRRVLVVIDQLESDELHFYVDKNRDRAITPLERIDGTGRERTVPLDAEIVQGDTMEHFPRQVALRLGLTGDRLSVATLGCVAGEVELKGPASDSLIRCPAQRIDCDANGLFADSRDRLRVDLDNNGKFDAVTEQFIWLPVQTLAGRRYAVKADRQGQSLTLDEITGTGHLQVSLGNLPTGSRISAFEAMVFSDDGSAWSLKEAQRPQEVPVGRYALGSVTVTIDTGEGHPWHFVFSRSNAVSEKEWVAVRDQGEVILEAVGELNLVLNTGQDRVRAGETLTITPRLYSEGGLLVNLSCRGRQLGGFDDHRTHNTCEVRLESGAGETLGSARSGFT